MLAVRGKGVHGFTLDPQVGEFILTKPYMKIPKVTSEEEMRSKISSIGNTVRRRMRRLLFFAVILVEHAADRVSQR